MPSVRVHRVALIIALLAVAAPMQGATARQGLRHAATMRAARSVHTATTLPSGQVLIAGGMQDGWASIDRAELFDPATNTTAELPALGAKRADHTATLLRDGQVLIAGGYDNGYLGTMELFDPASRRFRPAGALREPRSGHTATPLPDGRVLFVGGVGTGWTFLRTAELYDPATGRSEPAGEMSVTRESHTATLLSDGSVLIVGGHTGRRAAMRVHASAERWIPSTRRFQPAGTLVTPRHKHDAVRLADGRVLVVAGADRTDRVYFATTEVFDPRTGKFSAGPTMAHRRYKIARTSTLLPDGDVLVTSGARVAERLDVRRWTFREVPGTLPEAYRFAAAALLPDGEVVIAGGYSDANRMTSGVWRIR